MTEAKTRWEPTGLERFAHLEDKIYRVVEAFKAIRKENETLREENQQLRADLDALRESKFESLAHLQRQREELRERVEKALSLLATLETR
jgi:FtsZ-binding cell division protein ZapB